jgi:peptidoglycan/LPS O-acetylase OafA/YrhL
MFGFEGAAWMRNRTTVLLGNASYSIYLFHETIIESGAEIGKRLHFAHGDHRPVLEIVLLTLIALSVGIAVHLVIEKPLLIWVRSIVRGRRGSIQEDQQAGAHLL